MNIRILINMHIINNKATLQLIMIFQYTMENEKETKHLMKDNKIR